MSTSKPSTPRPKPEPNNSPGVIRADEVYVFEEACRRLRWRRHSAQQAKRLGLKPIKFGSRLYISGSAILKFFEDLARRQNEE